MRSPVESLVMSLLSFKRMVQSLTCLSNSRVEARRRLLAKSFFSQKKHCKILGSKGVRLRLGFIGLDWAASLPSAHTLFLLLLRQIVCSLHALIHYYYNCLCRTCAKKLCFQTFSMSWLVSSRNWLQLSHFPWIPSQPWWKCCTLCLGLFGLNSQDIEDSRV